MTDDTERVIAVIDETIDIPAYPGDTAAVSGRWGCPHVRQCRKCARSRRIARSAA